MPLEHSASKPALRRNIKTLMGEVGKSPHIQSPAQALAVAYSEQRRANRAAGGPVRGYDDGGGVASAIGGSGNVQTGQLPPATGVAQNWAPPWFGGGSGGLGGAQGWFPPWAQSGGTPQAGSTGGPPIGSGGNLNQAMNAGRTPPPSPQGGQNWTPPWMGGGGQGWASGTTQSATGGATATGTTGQSGFPAWTGNNGPTPTPPGGTSAPTGPQSWLPPWMSGGQGVQNWMPPWMQGQNQPPPSPPATGANNITGVNQGGTNGANNIAGVNQGGTNGANNITAPTGITAPTNVASGATNITAPAIASGQAATAAAPPPSPPAATGIAALNPTPSPTQPSPIAATGMMRNRGGALPRASGGFSMAKGPNLSPSWQERSAAREMRTGPILSAVPGRTDRHAVNVPSSSYVIPADVVSGRGQGNTLAGMNAMQHMFRMAGGGDRAMGLPRPPKPMAMMHSGGGKKGGHRVGDPVPVILAGGEFVVPPDRLMEVVHPNLDEAHRIMDSWILLERKKHRDTLAKLPGPAKD